MHNKKILKSILLNLPLIIILICCILPFIMIIVASFTDEAALANYGYSLIPSKVSTEAYKQLFSNPKQILRSYAVTLTVVGIGVPLSTLLMSGLAYPISLNTFKYKKVLTVYIFITMLFNGGLVPTYILLSKYLHLKDTIWVLIFPMLVGGWNVFLLRTFFQMVPQSLLEAAKIDGAGELKILFRIVLPLSKTGIATISLFVLLAYWNDWFMSLMYIDNDKIISLQYLLYKVMETSSFISQQKGVGSSMMAGVKLPDETLRMATCVVAAGPMVAVFPFFQKYFVKGITVGSVKG